jgi:WD40 repeat protein
MKPSDPTPLQAERLLFMQALEQPEGARIAFLDGACGKDTPLRQRVDALMRRFDSLGSYLEAPVLSAPDAEQPSAAAEQLLKKTVLLDGEHLGATIGRYKLLEKLGEGGFGAVWLAEQKEPVRRKIALKIIKLGMDRKQVVARFEAERQALALMDHPNIAKVLDAGATDNGRPYFVMELVRGIPITRFCDENKLATRERLDLFVKVCHAIQHAHQKGIIHRDIKPSNILVTLHDGVPVPKVIDFGIAKATQQDLTDKTIHTQFQQFIGTPAYVSPEQAELSGLDIDTRSDIYSLGVLLYELLVGQTPFDGKELLLSGLDEMRRTIREKEPLRPSTRLLGMLEQERTTTASRRGLDAPRLIHLLRGDLDWIVMRALEKDRTRRYETANGLAMDIQRHLNLEPVAARPPSAAYRLQKLVRRNKLAFAAGAAVAGALVLGLGLSTFLYFRESKARVRAEAAEDTQKLLLKQAQASEQIARGAVVKEAQQRELAEARTYAAKMNLTQLAWEQNNGDRVRQLLEETANWPGRGFEWYYWQRLAHQELKTFRGHKERIWSVAFSPNGQRIVTGSADQTAKVWDVATGKQQLTLKGHRGWIWSVAFSPDGLRIATAGGENTARVWDALTGTNVVIIKGYTSAAFYSVAFSPDGQRVVTGGADGTAKVWDSGTGRELLALKGHNGPVQSVAFSRDGRRIAAGSWDGTARVWDAATGEELLALEAHSGGVLSVAFSPDGQRIATGGWDHTAKMWEVSGKLLFTLQDTRVVWSVVFSPDGRLLATGSDDNTVKVTEAATGKLLWTLKGHGDGIRSVAFSPDGLRLATGSADGTAKVWEAMESKDLLTFSGHSNEIWSVGFSADGQHVVTASSDKTAKVWDALTGKELFTIKGDHSSSILTVAFSPDGRQFMTGSGDQTARKWDAVTGKELLCLRGHIAAVRAVAYSPDGRRIVTGSADQTAKVWDAATGTKLLTLEGHKAGISSVAYSLDGRRIVTGSEDKTVRIWDAASGKELPAIKGHSDGIESVAISPDGRRIVTGSKDQPAKLWDAATGTALLTLKGHNGTVWSVGFSPDGQRIVTGGDDGTVKVWETASGTELLSFKGHGQGWSMTAVAFSSDGRRIVAGCLDKTAMVWDAATAKQVADWQLEDRETSAHLAMLEREETAAEERQRVADAQNPGAIKEWLLLAPMEFEGQNHQAALEALDHEQIPRENDLRPRNGERVKVGREERTWRAVKLPDYRIDFSNIVGDLIEWSAAYAVCYIQSETEQSGLVIRVGSDDEAKIYLNGKQIYRNEEVGGWDPDKDEVAGVGLKAGLNVLVFKVVNENAGWQGSVRFTDAAGQPVKGIRVTLEP